MTSVQDGPPSSTRPSRRWTRLPHPATVGEEWILVLLGIGTLLIVFCVAFLSVRDAHQRDVHLRDARATAVRLRIGGHDDTLSTALITLQRHQSDLFRARVDAGQQSDAPDNAGVRTTAGPDNDLDRVQQALHTVAADPRGGSARVQRDVALISAELPVYQSLENAAQADNQQGLPVGAAYLREASSYFSDHILESAKDIRKFDQQRLAGDDRTTGRFPVLPVTGFAVGLVWLVAVQRVAARYSRRTFNPGLLGATVLVGALTVWSMTVFSVSRHDVRSRATPHAQAAAALTRVRDDATRADIDDQLTLADEGEDCAAVTTQRPAKVYHYTITCQFESDVLALFREVPRGTLVTDLDEAVRTMPDADAGGSLHDRVVAGVRSWVTAEQNLPTLQNLAAANPSRYNPAAIKQYSVTDHAPAVGTGHYSGVVNDLNDATTAEWHQYDKDARDAGGALGGLVTGGVLLGLLAGAAAGGGLAWRVAEYWSPGRRRQ